jgi:mono/diheme cytochrome c family protein
MKKKWLWLPIGCLGVLLVGFGALQLVPYGRNHTNPPVVQEPQWNTPETRVLAQRACFDCHSNETVWPWYSNVAPVSWLVQRDVDEGRQRLNFSDWNTYRGMGNEAIEIFAEGEMPPVQYFPTHPEAVFSAAEKQALIDGFSQSLK